MAREGLGMDVRSPTGRNDSVDLDQGESQRARKRESFFLMARLCVRRSDASWDVRIRNLSEGGLMAEVPKILDVGTEVTLDIRGIGEVAGKVAWFAEGRAGVALDHPIDPSRARKPVGRGEHTPVYAKPFTPF